MGMRFLSEIGRVKLAEKTDGDFEITSSAPGAGAIKTTPGELHSLRSMIDSALHNNHSSGQGDDAR